MASKDLSKLAWASVISLALFNGCATEIQETNQALAQLGDAGSSGQAAAGAGGTDASSGAGGTAAALAGTSGAADAGGLSNGGTSGTSQAGVAGSAGADTAGGTGGLASGGAGGVSGTAGAGGAAGGTAGKAGAGGAGGNAGAGGKGGTGGMAGAGGSAPVSVPCKKAKLTIKSATASSIEDDTLPASQAFDGDMATRWASAKSEPQWIYFDLGEVAHVSRVVINWEAAFATNYRLEIAQAAAGPWTSIFQESAGDGGADDVSTLTPKNGRYVRMYGSTRATVYGFSIYEFEIYGDLDETCK